LASKLPLVLLHFGKHFPNKRASKDAFGKNKHRSFQDLVLFKLMKFIAKAAIPDAEEAIPELWGTYFVSIVK
jgi:hypothetical protein